MFLVKIFIIKMFLIKMFMTEMFLVRMVMIKMFSIKMFPKKSTYVPREFLIDRNNSIIMNVKTIFQVLLKRNTKFCKEKP